MPAPPALPSLLPVFFNVVFLYFISVLDSDYKLILIRVIYIAATYRTVSSPPSLPLSATCSALSVYHTTPPTRPCLGQSFELPRVIKLSRVYRVRWEIAKAGGEGGWQGESPKMSGMPSGISVLVNYLLRFPSPPCPLSFWELFVVNYKGLPSRSTLVPRCTVGQLARCSMQQINCKLA